MKNIYLLMCSLLIVTTASAQKKTKSVNANPSIEQGRYLAIVAGCNDCHTPMYGPKNGDVPEKEWLSGSPVGWQGPWGTTYPTNLRERAALLSEDEWVSYLKNLKARPPMPYYAVNLMTDSDSRSLYRFISSLGKHPQKIPAGLPPGEKPKTPFINFDVIPPQAAK
ncbi:MAG: cytochrome C [Bdellovibrio sp.]|nr:cytochrome C [Bdellovibrio sp.]